MKYILYRIPNDFHGRLSQPGRSVGIVTRL
jgi:hypothetical protein